MIEKLKYYVAFIKDFFKKDIFSLNIKKLFKKLNDLKTILTCGFFSFILQNSILIDEFLKLFVLIFFAFSVIEIFIQRTNKYPRIKKIMYYLCQTMIFLASVILLIIAFNQLKIFYENHSVLKSCIVLYVKKSKSKILCFLKLLAIFIPIVSFIFRKEKITEKSEYYLDSLNGNISVKSEKHIDFLEILIPCLIKITCLLFYSRNPVDYILPFYELLIDINHDSASIVSKVFYFLVLVLTSIRSFKELISLKIGIKNKILC